MNEGRKEGTTMAYNDVVVYSGGLDSTVLLRKVADANGAERVLAVTFDYGQRHVREVEHAARVCKELRVAQRVVDMHWFAGWLAPGTSSQVDDSVEVPEGHYTDENMKVTVIPNRNMVMLSVAAAIAMSEGARVVYTAMHAGDHAVYPDCRPEFVMRLNDALFPVTGVNISAPFIKATKAEIVRYGAANGAPMGMSYSCYKGGERHCGRCGTCVERAEAFSLAGVDDPTDYEDPTYWLQAVRPRGAV
jgi:7-cyano-7-deazaguanine synthase